VAVAVAVAVGEAAVVSSGIFLGGVSSTVVVGRVFSEAVVRSVCGGEGGAVVVLGK
jgi:hypothetical protein